MGEGGEEESNQEENKDGLIFPVASAKLIPCHSSLTQRGDLQDFKMS